MPDLTLTQRFGSNVMFDEAVGTVTIKLSDLADQLDGQGDMTNGLGLDTSDMTAENKDSYSSRISWALLQLSAQNQPENNNDETVGVYISNGGRSNPSRNQVSQIGYRLIATAYVNDTLGQTLDPDAISG